MSSHAEDSETDASTTPTHLSVPEGTAPPSTRERIGDFELLEELGRGAFGTVYLAQQITLGRQVALKVTRQARENRSEGRVLAGLEHDHIVKVFSEFVDEVGGRSGLCLQYIPGADLNAVIREIHGTGHAPDSGRTILAALDKHRRGETAFDPAALRDRDALAGDDFAQAVCRIGSQLAEALAFAHANRVLHCDIKPANILMTPYGRPMLADFNVAFDRTRHESTNGMGSGIGGTLAYMSPEHRAAVRGVPWAKVDERCDVFSLGLVLHELATGKRPPKPRGLDEVEPPPDPLDTVPRELAAVIRRCLQEEPIDRYQTAAELATALAAAHQLLTARRALPPAGPLARRVTAHPILALVLAAFGPHVIASVLNISYNAVEIRLDTDQQKTFALLVVIYNLVAYPLLFGLVLRLLLQIRAGLRDLHRATGSSVDETRRHARHLGWYAVGLGVIGWLPGGVLFPLIIDLRDGALPWPIYAHFVVSFALAGLVGVVFSYLAIEYVVFRALLPRLGNPDRYTPALAAAEVRPLTLPFEPFLLLACAVPLAGAVLLVALADGTMTLGFRLLVTGLIGLGVAGVAIAERLVRQLRSLAAIW